MENNTATNKLANKPRSNPWSTMCVDKRIELGGELLIEAKDLLASGDAKAVGCFVRDEQLSNGTEYLMGIVIAGQATESGCPNGWDFLVEDDTPIEVELRASQSRLKNAPSDYQFKKVALCLADADNFCSTLIEIAVPQNMMDEFQNYALDLAESVLNHIREFAYFGLEPVLVTKLVITPTELTFAANAQKKRRKITNPQRPPTNSNKQHSAAHKMTVPKETWRDVLASGKAKKSPLQELPPHLRGESNNKYGGHQAQSMKTYETDWSQTYPCRSLSPEEIKKLEQKYNQPPADV